MDNSKGDKNHLLEGRDRESNGGNSSNRKIHNDSSAKGDESLVSAGQSKPSFRTTRWRWVALLFACFLLLGSYF